MGGPDTTKYAAYFGDQKANMYALDAENGKLLWKVKVDEYPVAQITGAPTLYEGRLYVPMASAEERTAGLSMTYACCTFRGSVTALDAGTGKRSGRRTSFPIRQDPRQRAPRACSIMRRRVARCGLRRQSIRSGMCSTLGQATLTPPSGQEHRRSDGAGYGQG